MKIACVQMNINFGEPEPNFHAVEKYIEKQQHSMQIQLYFQKCGILATHSPNLTA